MHVEGFSNEEWEHIYFRDAPFGIASVAADGHFLEVNRAYSEITGYSESELRKLRWQDITHPADISADQEMASELATDRTRSGYCMVKRYVRKDGRTVWVQLVGVPVRRDGQLHHYVAFVTALPESAGYHVAKAPDGSVVVKPGGISLWSLIKDNPKQAAIIFTVIVVVANDSAIVDWLKKLLKL